jgi:hypothetical protein
LWLHIFVATAGRAVFIAVQPWCSQPKQAILLPNSEKGASSKTTAAIVTDKAPILTTKAAIVTDKAPIPTTKAAIVKQIAVDLKS